MANYAYPIDLDWSHDEMVTVIHFLTTVEQAYEGTVSAQLILQAYQEFKQVVRSISEEKRIDRSFYDVSGYSLYRVVQLAKQSPMKKITMK